MNVESMAKRAIKSLPIIRGCFERKRIYLGQLAGEIERRVSELDRQGTELGRLASELDRERAQSNALRSENTTLKTEIAQRGALLFPPGHHHSPIVSTAEVQRWKGRTSGASTVIAGIDLNEDVQLRMIDDLAAFYAEMPFGERKTDGLRYYFENEVYSYADAIILYGMIRHLEPQKIIEVGSGFSSAVILDTNSLFFGSRITCTFIEPEPDRFRSLLHPGEEATVNLLEIEVQEAGHDLFQSLDPNDILFIDSSHVLKTGSDLDYFLREVLPALKPGVYVHFHDIFFPFEYPQGWVWERSWNEGYALRSFLQYNDAFSIQLFSDFLAQKHRDRLAAKMPLCHRNTGGNLWLRQGALVGESVRFPTARWTEPRFQFSVKPQAFVGHVLHRNGGEIK